jgi:hypothetical protein
MVTLHGIQLHHYLRSTEKKKETVTVCAILKKYTPAVSQVRSRSRTHYASDYTKKMRLLGPVRFVSKKIWLFSLFRNKPFFGFAKQTEKSTKTDWSSVRTEKIVVFFEDPFMPDPKKQ